MQPDSSLIINAVIAKLASDSQLLTLMPNGVYQDEAPAGSKQFVIVSQIIAQDKDVFGARAIEDHLFAIEARALTTTPADVKGAANRIDALLDPQPPVPPATIDVPGYDCMVIKREEFISHTETDDKEPSIRWKRRGGQYRVVMNVKKQT